MIKDERRIELNFSNQGFLEKNPAAIIITIIYSRIESLYVYNELTIRFINMVLCIFTYSID
jgi:hypothetical protein